MGDQEYNADWVELYLHLEMLEEPQGGSQEQEDLVPQQQQHPPVPAQPSAVPAPVPAQPPSLLPAASPVPVHQVPVHQVPVPVPVPVHQSPVPSLPVPQIPVQPQQQFPAPGVLTGVEFLQLDFQRARELAERDGIPLNHGHGFGFFPGQPLYPHGHGYSSAAPMQQNYGHGYPQPSGGVPMAPPTTANPFAVFPAPAPAQSPVAFHPVPAPQSALGTLLQRHFGPRDRQFFLLGHHHNVAQLRHAARSLLADLVLQADRVIIITLGQPENAVEIQHWGRAGLVRMIHSIPGRGFGAFVLLRPHMLQTVHVRQELAPEEPPPLLPLDPHRPGSYRPWNTLVRYRDGPEMGELGRDGLSMEMDIRWDAELLRAMAALGWWAWDRAREVIAGTRPAGDAPWFENFREGPEVVQSQSQTQTQGGE